MNIGKSGLIAVLFALAPLCLGSAGAQAQTFRLQVCNHSTVQASVATVSQVSPTDDRYVVEGWWSVGPGSCEWIGYFPQGWFYHYAEQTNTQEIVWEGTDAHLCVQYPGPFQRINTANYTCQSNERLRGFTGDLISPNTGTFTWNLD